MGAIEAPSGLPALVFLLPIALFPAEPATGREGGVYDCVSRGLSKPLAFLAVWCQFAMTVFYYPSLLGCVADTLAYVIDPDLAGHGTWTAIVIVVCYWAGVYVSTRGARSAAGPARGGHAVTTLVPGTVLAVLVIALLVRGDPPAAPADLSVLLPAWAVPCSLVLVVNNLLSYPTVAVSASHVSSWRRASKRFPDAMFLGMRFVPVMFLTAAPAISWVPSGHPSPTAGVMRAFDAVAGPFGRQWLTPVIGITLVAAALGGMLTWLTGPSKGLLSISRREGYLPPLLQRLDGHGVPRNILVAQGLATTGVALLYALVPDVSSTYWIFSVITTQVYLIPYLLMFVAVVRLRRQRPDDPRAFRAPMLVALCGIGFDASLAALLIGFTPPSRLGIVEVCTAVVAAAALGLGLLVPLLLYRLRRPSWQSPEEAT